MAERLEERLAEEALLIGNAVSGMINDIPRPKRGEQTESILKPGAGARSRKVDAVGEEIGFKYLRSLYYSYLSKDGYGISIIVDPQKNEFIEIGTGSRKIWCYFDAVDGTVKLSGLNNQPEKDIYRVGNNGAWATGIAFTQPTEKTLGDLTIGDFKIAAITDGNPTIWRAYPRNAFCSPTDDSCLRTYEMPSGLGVEKVPRRLATSTNEKLNQSTVLFDAFQAYDRNSAPKGAEELAVKVFAKLINRNEGGAFDIVRMYGNMAEVLRQLLEVKDSGIEPQGGGAVTVNENLPNLVPITPIIEGAGGYVVDFEGNPIRERKLKSERPNVVIAANETLLKSLLNIVQSA